MNKSAITEQVNWELQQLHRLAEVAHALQATPEEKRRPWDATAAAKYIADVFRGLENLCKRKSIFLDEPIPEGPDSHARILQEFLKSPGPGENITPEIAHRLRLYKSFRHRFIHGYGFELSWEAIEEPLRLLPETIEILCVAWQKWLDTL